MKVDGAISSLIQGISQQPARERLPGQGELQENFFSDPVQGLTRRGPLEFLLELLNSTFAYTFTDYDAGSLGHFIIAYRAGDIKVFDLAGAEQTITIDGSSGAYLKDSGMKFLGIDEDIYIVDPSTVTAMDATTKSYIEDGNLVFLLGGQYGRKYSITLTWKNAAETEFSETVTVSTPSGGTAADINDIATDIIAEDLETALNGNTTITDDFDIFRESDVLYIRKEVSADVTTYTTTVSDGDGGSNMFTVNNQVDDVGRLPRYAPQGYVVKVTESSTSALDDWYLEFVANADATGATPTIGEGFGREGVWVEAVAPDVEYIMNAATMPHILEKTGPTAFTFKEAAWANRVVGDNDTNPLPSFIGHGINAINAFQGRMVFLADVNCIMSRTNKYTNFFSQSATTLVDDDPIDMASAVGTFVLRDMVAHNRDLILFSDTAQFIIFGRSAITPQNSSLVLTTEFEADLSATPVAAGRNIFFGFNYGAFTGIKEFFTAGSEDINDSRSITQHVLQYIQGTPKQLVSTTNFTKLIIRTDNDPRAVYLHEYVWQGGKKVQSSWSTLRVSRDVVHMFFVDNLLYIITNEGNANELFVLNLDTADDTGLSYRVMLDDKIARTAVNTTFTVPYAIDDIDDYIAVQGANCPNPGMRAEIESYSSPTVTLKNDQDGGDIVFGRKYLSRYIPTSPFVKDRDGVKVGSGKLTLKSFTVFFAETGYFKGIVTDLYDYLAEVIYNGRVLGSPNNIVGEPTVSTGRFSVPYKKNADTSSLEIQSDSHLPLSLLEMEWQGQWRKKGKRITGG